MIVILYLADKYNNYSLRVLVALTMGIGVCGLLLGILKVNLPMFIDSSMTSLPFFMMGYVTSRHTSILKPNKLDKYWGYIIIACFAFVFVFASSVSYKMNSFSSVAFFTLYPCGYLGTLGIMYSAKRLNRLPLVSYWGRYSIMILVTHRLVYLAISPFVTRIMSGVNTGTVIVNFFITMLLYILIIPIMKKYLPYVTAQKDLIK